MKQKKKNRALSMLLALVMIFSLLPVGAWAANDGNATADTRTVYLTISLNGNIVKDKSGQLVAQRKIAVPLDNDNKCTIDDIMRYAHEQFSKNGVNDYSSENGKATKLWGQEPTEGQAVMFGTTASFPNKPLTDDINLEVSEDYLNFQLSAAIFSNSGAYTSRFVTVGKSAFMCRPIAQSVFKPNDSVTVGLIAGDNVGSSPIQALAFLSGYQPVAYDLNGNIAEDALEATGSDENGQTTIKFLKTGTYIISAVKTDSATKEVSPPAWIVTVIDQTIKYSKFELYADSAKTQSLTVTKNESSDEYTVAVPENFKTIYPTFALENYTDVLGWNSASQKNDGTWTVPTGSSQFGSGSVSLLQSGTMQKQIRINTVNTWNPSAALQVATLNIKKLPALSALAVDGYEQNAFDPNGRLTYRLYVDGQKENIDFTPTAKDGAYTITVAGKQTESGKTVSVPISELQFNEKNEASVPVTVHAEGEDYTDNTYTVVLEKQPQTEAPTVLVQPTGAGYIQGNTAQPMTVYASASGSVSYQWYRNISDSNEEGELLSEADSASYTPSTEAAGTYYYYCVATNETTKKATPSATACVTVDPDPTPSIEWNVDVPDVSQDHAAVFDGSTKGFYYRQGDTVSTQLGVKVSSKAEGGTWSYAWSMRSGNTTRQNFSSDETIKPLTDKFYGLCTYWCKVTYTFKGKKYTATTFNNPISVYMDQAAFTYPDEIKNAWSGDGTEQNPWKISDQTDLQKIQQFVAQGYAFEDMHFVLTSDVDLDNTWQSIGTLKPGADSSGNGENIYPFSATLDGGGHTLTYAAGTGQPLFAYVREATVRNMKIYAPDFKGLLLVSNYVVDYGADGDYGVGTGGSYAPGCPDTIDIENITVKKGSWMSGGAFIDGGASGGNTVNIRNCVIEPGVTMGKDKDTGTLSANVASFAGRISGTVLNCVSSADLFSSGSASGIVSGKCQSMGPFLVTNCGFLGSITAGDGYVGGIMGKGYEAESAPNTPCVSIQNCYVGAALKGSGTIGGIFGGEPYSVQNWAPAYIRNNIFYGNIKTTGDKAVAGGIVGFMYSLNKNNVIANNYYGSDCGAQRAIGNARYVDTSSAHETSLGISYFNTANGTKAGVPLVNGYDPAPKTDMNRTDDPFGKDADQLGKAVGKTELSNGSITALLNSGEGSTKNWIQGTNYPTISAEPVACEMTVSGNYKNTYYIGDQLDLTGIVFTVKWSDGSVTTPPIKDVKITGFDSSKRAALILTATYGTAKVEFPLTILKPISPDKTKITVYFTLLGDEDHTDTDQGGETHGLSRGGLQTWIPESSFTVDMNATAEDVFRTALGNANIEFEGSSKNTYNTLYISGVKSPKTNTWIKEFTNGPNSGWMFTMNGQHGDLGLSQQFLNDGDHIIFHYTDDWTKESDTHGWDTETGNKTTPGSTDTTFAPSVTAENGKAEVAVKESDLKDVISSAKTSGEAIVVAPTIKGTAEKVAVELPKASVSAISSETKADLKVETGVGSITIPNEALASIASQATDETVTVNLETVESSALTAEQQKAVGKDTVYDISILSGKNYISSFNGKNISIALPYTLKSGENAANVAVWYLNDAGKLERMVCTYDKSTGLASFATTHLSKYVVGYDSWSNPFTDVKSGDWFYDAVKFAAQKELFNGTSATSFAPDESMTRAMLVTVLYRMEGKPAVTGENSFTDVKAGQWYTDAVLWANANKLVEGYGNGSFGTNDSITREQMAVILYRYAQLKKYDVSKSAVLTKYSDAASISAWAGDAMKWANGEGLINGTTETTLAPAGTATRAQVAAVLMRFAENVAK